MATITLMQGDVIKQLRLLDDDSIDAIIADPPYNLIFMGKNWDNKGTPKQFEEWCCEWATECLRVLRSGGYLLSFGGTRTFHRITSGIEDAGFVIKDCLSWNYCSGFPKSHNISKAIDKKKGRKREVIGVGRSGAPETHTSSYNMSKGGSSKMGGDYEITKAASTDAKRWEGYGTALKPAWEPIILAQKPFKGTIVNNVLTHGVGGMNIDISRIQGGEKHEGWKPSTFDKRNKSGLSKSHIAGSKNRTAEENNAVMKDAQMESIEKMNMDGRWPANTIFDEEAGRILDEQSGISNAGGISRFFYCPKTPKKEKTCMGFVENKHPTVKPLKLMEYLVALVCPSGEAMGRTPVVLDCFVGSGSTAIAAHRLGFDCIGIDADEESLEITYNRLMNDWRLEDAPKPTIEGFILDEATENQLDYIGKLGGEPTPNMTKRQAGNLIDELKAPSNIDYHKA